MPREAQSADEEFDATRPSANWLHELLDDLRDRLPQTGVSPRAPGEILTIEELRLLQAPNGPGVVQALHRIARARDEDAKARHRQLQGLTEQAHRHSLRETNVLIYVDSVLARLVPRDARPAPSKLQTVEEA